MDMIATCQCGCTAIATSGTPIMTAVCYCESCRVAGREFEKQPGAPGVVRDDGGVEYTVFRKDFVQLLRGAGNLQEHRLRADSPTRRVVATCCNSPMFLDFQPGYWLSLYRNRLQQNAPEPTSRAHSKAFLFKLLITGAKMGFRRPKVAF